MNDSISVIEKQYNEIIKVNGYKNKLLPNNKKENNDMYENQEELNAMAEAAKKQLAAQQRVLVTPDNDCDFDSEQVTVKIKDKYFEK